MSKAAILEKKTFFLAPTQHDTWHMSSSPWSYSALIFSHQIEISDMCKLQFIIGYSRTNAVDLAAFAVCPWLFYYRLIRFPRICGNAARASRLPV